MNAPLPKAPFNWVAIFALVFLPIVAVIAIPLYAFQHDFSLAAWISMFVLLRNRRSSHLRRAPR